jgi:hypothetical protein
MFVPFSKKGLNFFRLLGPVSLMLALSSCATTPEKEGKETLLFNPIITANAFEVSVMSNGCTSAEDFYLIVDDDSILLRRTKPDLCRAASRLVRLSFDYSFNGAVFRIKNETRYSNRVERR